MAKVENWGATSVDVDGKMFCGRKNERGMTVTIGKKNTAGEMILDTNHMRRERANTLPEANLRRGDFELSPVGMAELIRGREILEARFRRGSVNVVFDCPTDDNMLEAAKVSSHCVYVGILGSEQIPGEEKERTFTHGSFLDTSPPPIISCRKGSKAIKDVSPNQDNFSFAQLREGYSICCCFDGHGPNGHLVSARIAKTLPYFFMVSSYYPHDIRNALAGAFQASQKDITATAIVDGWDVQASGSTCAVAVWKDDTVWTANVGDSRCVIGSEVTKTLMHQTRDHKPTLPDEKERIEEAGSEVRSRTYPDGWTAHRIFLKGKDFPGLCMSRSFGDDAMKAHGIVADPEIEEVKVDFDQKPFLILASDGVWEFLESEFVVKAVAKKLITDGPEITMQKLHRESRRRWKNEEGSYCDDITSVLVQLKPE